VFCSAIALLNAHTANRIRIPTIKPRSTKAHLLDLAPTSDFWSPTSRAFRPPPISYFLLPTLMPPLAGQVTISVLVEPHFQHVNHFQSTPI
jgi:hypothetical protein